MPPEGIPAAALLPESATSNNLYWEPRNIADNGQERLALASGIQSGWRYFTSKGQVRLSRQPFAESVWRPEIRYAYGHGPDKGPDKQERDSPVEIWVARFWHIERRQMVCGILSNYTLRSKITRLFENEQLMMTDSCLSNFYFTFYKSKNAKKIDYDVTATVKPCTAADVLAEAAKDWYPDNYWRYLNPFEEAAEPEPAPAAAKAAPEVPLTSRDENGADLVTRDLAAAEDTAGW